jgi:2,3-bisphosphoglycerate-independent phosphoglycerate mutase
MTKASRATQKCALLIVDGLGDLPHRDLGGCTPLEAAHTPIMNRFAAGGRYGVVDPIVPGDIPNTHSGTSLLFGLLPSQIDRLKRGPVEAAGAGQALRVGDVALRANFASVMEKSGDLFVTDRRAGRISSGADELAALVDDVDLGDGVRASFRNTDQHRGVLVLSGPGLNESIADTDPGSVDLPVHLSPCQPLIPEARFTAEKVQRFIELAHQRFDGHPINKARQVAGKFPANALLTRGAGTFFKLDNVLRDKNISVATVAGCNTVKGLGKLFGFDTYSDKRFTATFETDLDAKAAGVISALQDHDLVYLHIKAADICAHDQNPLAKRDFLERLDVAMQILWETDFVVALTADHTTDSNSGFHTADPVPTFIYDPLQQSAAREVNFGESECHRGDMARQTSSQFLQRVVSSMGY